ncbi:arsenic resistance protein [Dactylosporangium sp. CA-092794]|uniref:arsenic resistance protein n=1 Tax=Dactylosporangium sp. CA-092794 TaxID=3239929 RepID=UPI003D8B9806
MTTGPHDGQATYGHDASPLNARPTRWDPVTARLERYQVLIYLGAIATGALVGLHLPHDVPSLEHAINPVLGALLFVTFLQLPVAALKRGLRETRFLGAALTLNFMAVPVIVAGLVHFVPDNRGLRIGVLLVLLTPCVDYVIVFCTLANGSTQRLLAATPLQLFAQMALLPLFLYLMADPAFVSAFDFRPFVHAFVVVILIPLAAAWLLQAAASRRLVRPAVLDVSKPLPVPLMSLTLLMVVASEIPTVSGALVDIIGVVPVYTAFMIIMLAVGMALARVFRLDVGGSRAVVFTGSTRNSLVVLPLALALPAGLELAPAAVVTQRLVEIVGMVIFVWVVPRLIRSR